MILDRQVVAVCGSRFQRPFPGDLLEQEKLDQIKAAEIYTQQFIHGLSPGTIIVTGAAKSGADNWARQKALREGLDVYDAPANWEFLKSAAGFRRNPLVVAIADKVLAVWDGESKGTAHTINCAITQGVPVRIIVVGIDAIPVQMSFEDFSAASGA